MTFIKKFKRKNGHVLISDERYDSQIGIAEELNIERTNVNRAERELVKLGLIKTRTEIFKYGIKRVYALTDKLIKHILDYCEKMAAKGHKEFVDHHQATKEEKDFVEPENPYENSRFGGLYQSDTTGGINSIQELNNKQLNNNKTSMNECITDITCMDLEEKPVIQKPPKKSDLTKPQKEAINIFDSLFNRKLNGRKMYVNYTLMNSLAVEICDKYGIQTIRQIYRENYKSRYLKLNVELVRIECERVASLQAANSLTQSETENNESWYQTSKTGS